jgi:hypothetical protein
MDAAPVKPQPPAPRPPARPAPGAGARTPAHASAAHPVHAAAAKAAPHGAHGADPATPDDFATLQRQSQFDAIASARAEAQREMNILRDLAMQQVKRDDATVGAWIKLI